MTVSLRMWVGWAALWVGGASASGAQTVATAATADGGVVVEASRYAGVREMEAACGVAASAGVCTVSVGTQQTITLARDYALPPGVRLRFAVGGMWVVDGAALTVSSGVVDAPEKQRVFAGTGEVRGLKDARPEWFVEIVAGQPVPADGLARAYRATLRGATIWMGEGSYDSPFFRPGGEPCTGPEPLYTTARRFVGVGRPGVDDAVRPEKLVGRTIVRGGLSGLDSMQVAHLGVDVGPGVVRTLYGGVPSFGICLPNHGKRNPKSGTRIEDVSVLSSGMLNQHTVILEGEDGAVVQGLWIWSRGGTHGLVVKSSHTLVQDFHCTGAVSDCLIVKSDYATAGDGYAEADLLRGIDIHYLERPGDTGGIVFDARWDRVWGITFTDVEEDGLRYGLDGGGSWFHSLADVTVGHWTAREMVGPCAMFQQSERVSMEHFVCETAAPAAFVIGGKSMELGDGTIGCVGAVCPVTGVVDSGKGTVVEGVTGTRLGGFLVGTMPGARGGAYRGLRVLDMDSRIVGALHPKRRSFGEWFGEVKADWKQHLRILWETLRTTLGRVWRWVRGKSS